MDKKIIFQIGELARLQNISNQTLIYYDRTGLLKAKTDPVNGYRYYSQDDIYKLDTINSLKESGMTLKGIKNYLETESTEKTLNLLEEQVLHLEKSIIRMKDIKLQIDKRIQIVQEYKTETSDIGFCDFQGMDIAMMEINPTDDEKTLESKIKQLFIQVKKLEPHRFLEIGALTDINYLRTINHDTKKTDIELKGFFIPLLKPYPENPVYKKIKKGEYSFIIHKGSYLETCRSYKKLMAFIKDNNKEPAGDSIDLPIIDDLFTRNQDEFVTKILIPVS
jgi:DNA-binding transcriptional MerR regulator